MITDVLNLTSLSAGSIGVGQDQCISQFTFLTCYLFMMTWKSISPAQVKEIFARAQLANFGIHQQPTYLCTEYFQALNIRAKKLPLCNFSAVETGKTFPQLLLPFLKTGYLRGLSVFVFIVNKLSPFEKLELRVSLENNARQRPRAFI